MFRTGAGGFVTITKNADDQLDSPYAVPQWADGGKYLVDDIVYTAANTGDAIQFWRSKSDRDGESTDLTASTDATPAKLSATYWDPHEVGTLYGLTSWSLTRPVTETEVRLLIESTPRVSYGTGAVTLELNFLDNFEGSPLQRVLAVPNSSVYVRLYPKGKATGREIIQGQMRVGESTHESGTGEEQLSRTVTLAADGDFVSSAQA